MNTPKVHKPKVLETILTTVSDDKPMTVIRKRPISATKKTYPKVIIFHDAPGIREATHTFCRRLADCGFDVIVPDLHHRQGRLIGFSPHDIASDPTVKPKIYELLDALTDDGMQQDLDATLELVNQHKTAATPRSKKKTQACSPERAYCIGFCIGARAVFHTMMRLPDQFVAGSMWHPSYLVDDTPNSPHLTASELPGSLYVGFGEADETMSVASMQPFIDAVAPLGDRVTIDIHPEADHGYTWSDSPAYNQDAAEKAWTRTLELFRKHHPAMSDCAMV